MAEFPPNISEGPVQYDFMERGDLPPLSVYSMPERGDVTVEHQRGSYAIFWTTDKTPQEAYEYISERVGVLAEVIAGIAIPGKNSKPVSFRSVNFVQEIISGDSALVAPELTLDDLEYWGLDYRNGPYFAYVQRPDGEDNQIKMQVNRFTDAASYMQDTAIPEIAQRVPHYFA